jgi:hypothetical protein
MIRTGKIARLPRAVRDELNRRLENTETGDTLLPWLNALPEVRAVLAHQFDGVPVTKQNLSEWRTGGFAEWRTRQDTLFETRELADDGAEVTAATRGRLTDHLGAVLAARYASAMRAWDGQPSEAFSQKLSSLHRLCQDFTALRRADHSHARLQLERDRIEAERERTEAEVVAQFEKWAQVPAVRDWLCQTWVTPEAREQRKREIFGLTPPSAPTVPVQPEPEPKRKPQSESPAEKRRREDGEWELRWSDAQSRPAPRAESPQATAASAPASNPVAPSQTTFSDPPASPAEPTPAPPEATDTAPVASPAPRTPDPESETPDIIKLATLPKHLVTRSLSEMFY